jgi:hypothetical protein
MQFLMLLNGLTLNSIYSLLIFIYSYLIIYYFFVIIIIIPCDFPKYYGWANNFYNTQAKIGWYRTWYDDENWMAMALIHAYDI